MAAKPKPFPKSLGACADMLFDLREARLALDKLAAEAKERETALSEHIISILPKDSGGAIGKHHKVIRQEKTVPQLDSEKDQEFFAYVGKTKRWDLLQRRLSEKAIMELIDAGKTVPGIKMFKAIKLSLTKV